MAKKMVKKIQLGGKKALTLEEVYEICMQGRQVDLASAAQTRIRKAHGFLQKKVKSGSTHYGVNTGFGVLSNVRVNDADLEQLQYNIVRSHAVGVGPAIEEQYVRGMLLLRANSLVQGNSGVHIDTVRQLIEFLNRGVHPVIPSQGSVGASGDLAPLAHLALVLIGEGEAFYGGKRMSGRSALKAAKLKPIRLGPKEGLALINGTQFMTAYGVLNLLDAEYLCDVADLAGAATLEAVRGTVDAFDPLIHGLRPHPGQIQVAKTIRKHLMPNGKKSQIAKSHEGCGRVQDPYSLRCIPQVHGAARDMLSFVRSVLEREINAVTDNPLIFPEQGKILSGGNFHGEIIAMAMDQLAIAMAEIGNISEQRIQKLMNPVTSELPTFLIEDGGLNSGLMMVQVSAAALVSENKTLAHPASVDSIPTNVDKEDHVSMGPWAARKARSILNNVRRVLVMELVCSMQGIDLLRPLRSSPVIENLYHEVRQRIRFMDRDREIHSEMMDLEKFVEERGLLCR